MLNFRRPDMWCLNGCLVDLSGWDIVKLLQVKQQRLCPFCCMNCQQNASIQHKEHRCMPVLLKLSQAMTLKAMPGPKLLIPSFTLICPFLVTSSQPKWLQPHNDVSHVSRTKQRPWWHTPFPRMTPTLFPPLVVASEQPTCKP